MNVCAKRYSPPKRSVAKTSRLMSSCKPHYFELYLWKERKAMVKALRQAKDVMAVTHTFWNPHTDDFPQPSADDCLGQIHFARGAWSVEIVSHEVLHAILHRARFLPPTLGHVIETRQDLEEVLAYEAGEWTQALFDWLRANDPGFDPGTLVDAMRRDPAEIICNPV